MFLFAKCAKLIWQRHTCKSKGDDDHWKLLFFFGRNTLTNILGWVIFSVVTPGHRSEASAVVRWRRSDYRWPTRTPSSVHESSNQFPESFIFSAALRRELCVNCSFATHQPPPVPPTFHTLSSFVGRSNGPGQSCGTLVVHSAGWAIAIVMRDEERHKRTNIRNGVQFCRRRRGRSKWCCSMGVGWFAVNEIVAVCWPRKIFPSFFYGIKTFSSTPRRWVIWRECGNLSNKKSIRELGGAS